MNKLTKFFIILLIISFSFILFLSNFRFLVFNESYYASEFKKLGVYERTPEAKVITKDLIDFFRGKQPLSAVFDEREAKHLVDVKDLINKVLLVFYSLGLISVLLLSSLFVFNKKEFINLLSKTFVYGSLIVLFVSLILFLFSFKFSYLFSSFHSLLFKGGTWFFPADSLLINVFPEKFFYGFFCKIVLYSCIESVSIIFFVFFLRENKKIKKFLNKQIKSR